METVFRSPEEKNILYNRLFETLNRQHDPRLKRKLDKAFDGILKANREWDSLVMKSRINSAVYFGELE